MDFSALIANNNKIINRHYENDGSPSYDTPHRYFDESYPTRWNTGSFNSKGQCYGRQDLSTHIRRTMDHAKSVAQAKAQEAEWDRQRLARLATKK